MTPLPPIVHLLAVAVGVYGGFTLMGKVTPDLPDPDTAAAVSAPAQPGELGGADQGGEVGGGDQGSLLRPGPLSGALGQLSDQLAAGERIQRLRIQPGRLQAASGSGEGFEPGDVDLFAPTRISLGIAAGRSGFSGLRDVRFMTLKQLPKGLRWFVQTTLDVPPPRTYGASPDGATVTAGR